MDSLPDLNIVEEAKNIEDDAQDEENFEAEMQDLEIRPIAKDLEQDEIFDSPKEKPKPKKYYMTKKELSQVVIPDVKKRMTKIQKEHVKNPDLPKKPRKPRITKEQREQVRLALENENNSTIVEKVDEKLENFRREFFAQMEKDNQEYEAKQLAKKIAKQERQEKLLEMEKKKQARLGVQEASQEVKLPAKTQVDKSLELEKQKQLKIKQAQEKLELKKKKEIDSWF